MDLRYSLSVLFVKPDLEQLERVSRFVEGFSRTPIPKSIWDGHGNFYSTEVTTTEIGMRDLLRRINDICGPNVKKIDITNPQMAYVKQGRN